MTGGAIIGNALHTGYAINLMHLVFDQIVQDPRPYITELQRIPVPPNLCAALQRPTMEEAVGRHLSRFSQGGV